MIEITPEFNTIETSATGFGTLEAAAEFDL